MSLQIYNDDCFNVFTNIKVLQRCNENLNLVCVDLPYGQTDCDWDVKIDLNKMWEELDKICPPNCTFAFFCTSKFGYELIHSRPKWFAYDLVWVKNQSTGFMNANRQPLRNHEMIYIFRKPVCKKPFNRIYNPQKTEGKPYKSNRNGSLGTDIYRGKKHVPIDNKGDRYPLSVLYCDLDKSGVHYTAKPILLLEWLIKTYTNEGDYVLDFTMGSGSTGIACQNTNRNFIGVEKNLIIFERAKSRLEQNELRLKPECINVEK